MIVVLSGCSSSKREVPSAGGNAELGSTSDINPQDPATLRTGGNLRLALSSFPSNFNTLNLDGNEADTGSLLKPTMPRAFVIAADGSMKVDTDYFTTVELTSTSPQVVTYTINPKATWSDGTPITWDDIASQINSTSGKDKAYAIAAPNGSDRVELFHRFLDPLNNVGDRGLQAFEANLSGLTGGRIYLQVKPGPYNDFSWDWTGWTDIQIK